MKKITAGVVALCLGIIFPVWAQDRDPRQERSQRRSFLEELLTLPADTVGGFFFNLGEIKVAGSRVGSTRSEVTATDLPHNVTVVSSEEIQSGNHTDLPALLGTKEGVTHSDDIGQGLNARVDLRGFGGEAKQALVVFDGIRAVEPFDDSMSWHLYPSEYLREVQIERGGATIYGEGALSGVIRLDTKEPTQDFRIFTEHSLGNFRTWKDFAEASGTTGPVGFYVGGRYFTTDGYRQNAGHESGSTLSKVRIEFSDALRFENTFYYADNDTGIPGPLTAIEAARDRRQKDPDGQFGDKFQDEIYQDGMKIEWFVEPLGLELANLFGIRDREQNSVQSFGGAFGGTSLSDIDTLTYSDVLQLNRSFERGPYQTDLTAGIEWSLDDIHNPSAFNSFTFAPFRSDRAIDRRMLGYFVQNRTRLGKKWTLEAGLRYDDIDWDIYDLLAPNLQKRKTADNLSPRFGVEYKFFEPLSVFGSYSQAFKAPDSNALIFETPNIFTPNPNIDPSTAHHYEAGLRYAHPVFGSIRTSYFYIETKKEILFNDIANTNENFDTVRQGMELAQEIALTRQWTLYGGYTYTRAHFDNGAFDGKTIPLVPESRWSAGLRLAPGSHWTFSMGAVGVREQFALNDFNNIFPVENYWTLNARISYQRGSWEFFVRAENLLNEEYSSFVTSNGVDTLNVNPAPELYVEGGFRYTL